MIHFTKMHGIGNDYIYIDSHVQTVDDPAQLALAMSDRHTGVGADGVILIMPNEDGVDADLRMRMYNANGSEAEMCGNGIRCVCKYAHDHGLCREHPMRIQTRAGVLTLEYALDEDGLVESVTVDMGEPKLKPASIPVVFPRAIRKDSVIDFPLGKCIPINAPAAWMEDCELDPRMTCVSMGNPHVVIYCGNVDAVPLESVGPFIERQAIFPNRINVHFVQVVSRDDVIMRTWERGSGITMACGTGACAVCVAGALSGRTDREVCIHLPGGDLHLRWDEKTNHVFMTGTAKEVFTGEWHEKVPSHAID